MRSLRHVIHGAALAEILKLGPVAGLDEEHYWGFLDNTYIDDVSIPLIQRIRANRRM